MKIAILGIRGLPSTYSGFESFVGEIAPRLIERGHEVTIYCRKRIFKERPTIYTGMKMIYLPSLEHKFFSTLTHSFFSLIHASTTKNDVILVVNAANGIFGFIPKIFNKKAVLNVNGMEWLRPKWNRFGKWFFKFSAKLGTKFYDKIITDADEMQRLYAREFGVNTSYIAYGANIEYSDQPEILHEYGLKADDYYLIASRLVPDNNADIIIEGFVKSGSNKKLVIAGSADYKGNKVEAEFLNKLKSLANENVFFLGHIGNPNHVIELHCNAFAYIHGHEYGGINPALLKALGCGNLVLAHNTPFNSEVLNKGEFGILFENNAGSLSEKIKQAENSPDEVNHLRSLARGRIKNTFSWEKITDQYEELFHSLNSGKKLKD
ncbi:MAG: glycosyltransferase [Daejeonella sp.]